MSNEPSEPTVRCPSCRAEIKLTESLAAPLVEATRAQFRQQLAAQAAEFERREHGVRLREEQLAREAAAVDATVADRLAKERASDAAEAGKRAKALADREAALAAERTGLAAERAGLDATVDAKLKHGREQIAADEARKARVALGDDLEARQREVSELTAVLKSRDEKLAEAQRAQADLIRKGRELDDAKREVELTVETRVQAGLATVRSGARQEAEAELSLKVVEKEQVIDAMRRQIEDLKRRAEQGSQQSQGEALELQLEALLAGRFPHDRVDPVPKGEHGGDILHRVHTPAQAGCGTILWEFKRTKNWSDGWLGKLREDQRQAKAEIAVIVSVALPRSVETFDQIDGVWVVHPRCVLPVALSLRHMLMEVTAARVAGEGQQTKQEMLYGYLTGPKFRLRVQAIVEAFSTMRDDLNKERKLIHKQWAKREEQIDRVMTATVGMWGEMQGIAGQSLQEIEGLRLDDEDDAPPALA